MPKKTFFHGSQRRDELPEDINTEEKIKEDLAMVIGWFKDNKEKVNLTDTGYKACQNKKVLYKATPGD